MASGKRDEQLLRLENSSLKLASKPQQVRVDVSSELRVAQALTRRGVALEMCGVCSFSEHESYARALLAHVHRPAPPGYQSPTLDQALRADRELWIRISETVRHQFAGTHGTGPVDDAISPTKTLLMSCFTCTPCPCHPSCLPILSSVPGRQHRKARATKASRTKAKASRKARAKALRACKPMCQLP